MNERALPEIKSPFSPREAVDRLEAAAKRGGLPGFARAGSDSFSALVFGAPFDRELHAHAVSVGSGSTIRCVTRVKPRLPLAYAIALVLTAWPGVWVTDSMLKVYFSWYRIETWWWYLPLCALMIPAAWKQWQRSERTAAAEALKLQATIAAEVKGAISMSAPANA